MPYSIRLNAADEQLIKKYAAFHGISMGEFMRQAAIEKIEDEYDLKVLQETIAEHEKNPVTYTHEEVGKMLGFK